MALVTIGRYYEYHQAHILKQRLEVGCTFATHGANYSLCYLVIANWILKLAKLTLVFLISALLSPM